MKMNSKNREPESTDRAVSPVIGVILMVAITVILAAVIAAFVLDIGPGDTDPTAAVDVSDNGTDEVTVSLTSSDDNTDGIVIIAEDDEGDGDISGDAVGVLTTSGAEESFDDDEISNDEQAEYTVRAFSGDADDIVDDVDGDGTEIGDYVDAQTIEEEFTVVSSD